MIEAIQSWSDDHPGARSALTLRTLFVGFLANAIDGIDGQLTEVTKALRAVPAEVAAEFGLDPGLGELTYAQVHRLWRRVREAVGTLNTIVGGCAATDLEAANWIVNRLLRASLPADIELGSTWAIDSTDVEPWARTRVGIPEDPTKRWTKDPEVSEGHYPAKNAERGGARFLSELHLATTVRDVGGPAVPGLIEAAYFGRPNVDRAKAAMFMLDDVGGPAVPGLIEAAYFGRPNVDRAKAAMFMLDDAAACGRRVAEVVVDRGYSELKAEHFAAQLLARRVDKAIDLMPNQRRREPFRGALVIDGGFFCPAVPEHLRELPPYRPNMAGAAAAALAGRYDERARYAFSIRQQAGVAGGAARFECGARAGRLRCPLVDASMRADPGKPVVDPPSASFQCCAQATITVPAELHIKDRQRLRYGTSAWMASYRRRPAAESSNALLKTHYASVRRGYARCFGLVSQALLVGFAAVRANARTLRAFTYVNPVTRET